MSENMTVFITCFLLISDCEFALPRGGKVLSPALYGSLICRSEIRVLRTLALPRRGV